MSDRKYRQSGYQDGGRAVTEEKSRSRGEAPEGPRGRGLGAPTRATWKCSRCGRRLDGAPARDRSCPGCGSDLHTCTNCRHFDSSAPKECRQPVEIRIVAKAKRNDCSLFEAKMVQEFASDSSPGGSKQDAKAAFDDLFDF